jgi:hypothetical protein
MSEKWLLNFQLPVAQTLVYEDNSAVCFLAAQSYSTTDGRWYDAPFA